MLRQFSLTDGHLYCIHLTHQYSCTESGVRWRFLIEVVECHMRILCSWAKSSVELWPRKITALWYKLWTVCLAGYIPRMSFRYGGTYKEDCDACIGEHVGNMDRYTMKDTDLNRTVRGNPRLMSLQGDPTIKNHLNTYRDTHPERPLLMGKYQDKPWPIADSIALFIR